jgi:hypothetical protein
LPLHVRVLEGLPAAGFALQVTGLLGLDRGLAANAGVMEDEDNTSASTATTITIA